MLLLVTALFTSGETDFGWWLSWLAFFSWLACAGVTAAKGKWGVLALDVFVWLFSFIAAFRLAKPGSLWARKRYGPDEMHRALLRFGEQPIPR